MARCSAVPCPQAAGLAGASPRRCAGLLTAGGRAAGPTPRVLPSPRPLPSQQQRSPASTVPHAARRPPPSLSDDVDAKVRAEVEAPFRIVRLVLCGFFGGSATVGAAIAAVQVLAAASGSAGAPVPLAEAARSLGIDVAAAGAFAFFFSRDWAARQKQLARLSREGALGALRVRLASGKTLRLRDLRGFARPVLLTGTPAQVGAALAAVTPELKAALVERGVLVVPVPVEERGGGGGGDGSAAASPSPPSAGPPTPPPIPPLTPADLRWRAAPADPAAARAWFADQAAVAGADTARGLYVGLRMDGRVRASGVGCPNWGAFAAQLPPVEAGTWDGMDGKI